MKFLNLIVPILVKIFLESLLKKDKTNLPFVFRFVSIDTVHLLVIIRFASIKDKSILLSFCTHIPFLIHNKLNSLSTSVLNNNNAGIYTKGSLGVSKNVYIGDINHTNAEIQIGDKTQIHYEKYGNEFKLNFANGGDQNNDIISEATVCNQLGIELIHGLGDKIQSSSWLLNKQSGN